MAKMPSPDAHWRDSARAAKFFIFEAQACLPLLLFLLHIRWWTLWVAIGAMVFLLFIGRYGFTGIVFLRVVRSFLAGSRKLSRPWWLN